MDRDQGMGSSSACRGNKKPRDAMQSAPWQGFESAGYQNAANLHAVSGCTHITLSIRLTYGCHASALLSVEISMSSLGNIYNQLYGTVPDCQVGDFSSPVLTGLDHRTLSPRGCARRAPRHAGQSELPTGNGCNRSLLAPVGA